MKTSCNVIHANTTLNSFMLKSDLLIKLGFHLIGSSFSVLRFRDKPPLCTYHFSGVGNKQCLHARLHALSAHLFQRLTRTKSLNTQTQKADDLSYFLLNRGILPNADLQNHSNWF